MRNSGENPCRTRLALDRAQLLLIDVQEKLLPRIDQAEPLVAQCVRMLRIAREMGLPITATEQNPEGLGPTVAAIRDALGPTRYLHKKAFSVCGDAAAMEALRGHSRGQVLVMGIEAHVCVMQTSLDLLDAGFEPFVLADAAGSRRPLDREIGFQRMARAGVVLTTVESAAFELMRRYDSDLFRRVLPHVR